MSAASIRPVLRPSALSSISNPSTSSSRSVPQVTTYICTACRHARLLRRPKRPYTFTQLVTLSDGSAFTMRTTSPMPVYRSTRDTRNAPLWNPSSKELLNVEDDEAGRLAGFRARFGKGFDLQRDPSVGGEAAEPASIAGDAARQSEAGATQPEVQGLGAQSGPYFRQPSETKHSKGAQPDVEDYYEFEEDDANLLDLISSYGQEVRAPKAGFQPPPKAGGKSGKK